jgi:predicted DNA-binding transcriptional regulator AlpA
LPRGGVAIGRAKAAKPADAAEEISPQEAAAILQMSRPSVMRLIAKGQLHPRKVLSHNKLSRAEVVNYQIEQSREQRQALSNLVTLTEDYDL